MRALSSSAASLGSMEEGRGEEGMGWDGEGDGEWDGNGVGDGDWDGDEMAMETGIGIR